MKAIRTINDIEYLLPRIKNVLKSMYGNDFIDAILYGSFAKNTPTEDSDIDIAVVLKGRINKVKEIDRICDALYDMELESGELISVYPLSEDEIKNSVWPLYYHIKTDGIKL